jgi:hypothetical protein
MESVMKASFVYNINTTRVIVRQPKVLDRPYQYLPRPMRKALRVTTPKAVCNTHQGVDHYLRTDFRTDDYHNQNLEFLARDYGYDEFNDIDNEFEGLTIVEPSSEVELFEFCTGYNEL